MIVCLVAALFAAWSAPRPAGSLEPQRILLADDNYDHARVFDAHVTELDAFVEPELPPPDAAPVPVDPRVDEAFAALDRSRGDQLDAFLAAYGSDAYAIAQGYVAQADEWRREAHRYAKWRAEDERLRKQQNSVEWIHD